MQIFSIPIDTPTPETVKQMIRSAQTCSWIVTVNPEILLEARRNPTYAHALKQADLRLVDGFGLQLMLRLFGVKSERWPGIDMAKECLAIAKEKNWRIAFLGGKNQSADEAKKNLDQELDLKIYAEQGGNVDVSGQDDEAGEEARHRLTLFDPQVLFVAFGHPKQEQWILKHAQEFPNLKLVIGVGGSFDIWSGQLKRAPIWMQRTGLEWLWRLIQQPSRILRILKAVLVFPAIVLIDRLKSAFRLK